MSAPCVITLQHGDPGDWMRFIKQSDHPFKWDIEVWSADRTQWVPMRALASRSDGRDVLWTLAAAVQEGVPIF